MIDVIEKMNKWLEHRALAEFIDKGYRLTRYGDSTIGACFKDEDKPFAVWPEDAVTQQQIYDACKAHDARLAGAASGEVAPGWVDL